MDFLNNDLLQYCEQNSTQESQILKHIHRETHAKILMPRMLSGHLQGNVLATFSMMINPKRILEIGTYTGYSAICLAQGLMPDGLLYTLDINEELESMVNQNFEKAGLQHQVKMLIGNALEIIPTLKETFDLVFIDADKMNYSAYYDLVFDKVRIGGFIIADNVLWSGKVVDENCKDKDTLAMKNFNQKVQDDHRVFNTLFPIRDGLMVAKKLCN